MLADLNPVGDVDGKCRWPAGPDPVCGHVVQKLRLLGESNSAAADGGAESQTVGG